MNKYEFEITAALNNHDGLTGYGISKFIQQNFHHMIGCGTLYLYLDRLTKNGKIIRTKTVIPENIRLSSQNIRFTYKLRRQHDMP
jgi:DNA-binding PadR family transcriptional regulator